MLGVLMLIDYFFANKFGQMAKMILENLSISRCFVTAFIVFKKLGNLNKIVKISFSSLEQFNVVKSQNSTTHLPTSDVMRNIYNILKIIKFQENKILLVIHFLNAHFSCYCKALNNEQKVLLHDFSGVILWYTLYTCNLQ